MNNTVERSQIFIKAAPEWILLSSRANTSVFKDGNFNLEENKLRPIQSAM